MKTILKGKAGGPCGKAFVRLNAGMLAGLFALGALAVANGSAAEPDLTGLSLEDLGSLKVETVYGASKHEQNVTDAPSAVSIITREDIQ